MVGVFFFFSRKKGTHCVRDGFSRLPSLIAFALGPVLLSISTEQVEWRRHIFFFSCAATSIWQLAKIRGLGIFDGARVLGPGSFGVWAVGGIGTFGLFRLGGKVRNGKKGGGSSCT